MGVFTKLIDSIDHDEIKEHIDNNIDADYTYTGDWSGEQHHANLYLNKLLSSMARGHDVSANEMRQARRTLTVVESEEQLDDWIVDLHENYFPLLMSLWD